MPLIVDKKLPAYQQLKRQLVSEMTTERAKHQDIRPLEIGILNLMPAATVERTEIQFLRLLANTPLQIHPTLIYFDKHKSSKQDHFDAFYRSISEVKKNGLDGLIITGGNLESHKFEEIFFWNELTNFFDWAHTHVTSTVYACWAAQAALYHSYDIKPHVYRKKIFGVFPHEVKNNLNSPLTAGMDDQIFVPHARQRGIESKDVKGKRDLEILIESKEVGPHLIVGRKGRELYVQGHQEYDRNDIAGEYHRDVSTGLSISFPQNYFPEDDENKVPIKNWGANGQVLYANWVNWVYQTTNFDVKKPLIN